MKVATVVISLTLVDAHRMLSLGRWLGHRLPAGTVILLRGNLGSGKTTLVKGIGQGLGITDTIDSPTFTLVNEYLEGRVPLYHVDLYRLNPTAAEQLFLETYWEGLDYPLGLVAIEWPERLRSLPPTPLAIDITDASSGRTVVLTPSTLTQSTLLEALTLDAILADEI